MTKRKEEYSLDPNVTEIPDDGDNRVTGEMTKRTGHIESDELNADEQFLANGIAHVVNNILDTTSASLQRLIDSNIVTATDSAISWREGHLEHVARLYVSDPAQAWRDYADDLTVALSADGSTFAALVERARGE